MSEDDVSTQEVDEQIDSSEETQNVSVEDNSHGEGKKNQSNFKKLAKRYKEERKERERLQTELDRLKSGSNSSEDTEEDDFDFGGDSDDDHFSDVKSEIFFLKTKDADKYRDEMEQLLDENPKRKNLPLQDLLDLAKARYPKSNSKKTFDVSSVRSGGSIADGDISKIDVSKLSEEDIENMPVELYKKLFGKK